MRGSFIVGMLRRLEVVSPPHGIDTPRVVRGVRDNLTRPRPHLLYKAPVATFCSTRDEVLECSPAEPGLRLIFAILQRQPP
jgi:hypothetical protein